MRYTLFLHWPEMTPAEIGEAEWKSGEQAFHAYAEALADAGVLVSAEVLQSSSATRTLRIGDGGVRVQDGPYADTREQIGGTFVLDVADLDAALAWAEKCPSAQWGTIEVRPTAARFVDGAWVGVE